MRSDCSTCAARSARRRCPLSRSASLSRASLRSWRSAAIALALVVEPLQRHGDAAHWTMLFIAIILTTAIGFLIPQGVTTRAFNRVADYSYTLYLIHYPLLLLAFGLLHPVLHRYEWGVSLAMGCLMATLVLPVAAVIASVAENRELIRRRLEVFRQWFKRKGRSERILRTGANHSESDKVQKAT